MSQEKVMKFGEVKVGEYLWIKIGGKTGRGRRSGAVKAKKIGGTTVTVGNLGHLATEGFIRWGDNPVMGVGADETVVTIGPKTCGCAREAKYLDILIKRHTAPPSRITPQAGTEIT